MDMRVALIQLVSPARLDALPNRSRYRYLARKNRDGIQYVYEVCVASWLLIMPATH